MVQEKRPRFFWPPPPGKARIEYINYYYSSEDLQRGTDLRLEHAILGKKQSERLVKQPYSIASDGKGRFFTVDFADSAVHVFDVPRRQHRLLLTGKRGVQKVFVDRLGEIWILDSIEKKIHHYSVDETPLSEIHLPGVDNAASICIDRSRNRIYVVDSALHQLRLYDLAGRYLQAFGVRGLKLGEFNFPGDVDLDASGNLYIVDALNARIQVLTPDGLPLRTFGERGTVSGAFSLPKGIAVSPSGLVYVSDASQHKVVIFNTAGEYLLTLGGRFVYSGKGVSPGGFYFPAGLDVDANDTLWVADLMNGIVHEFQYLTPEFLARHPIRDEEIYRLHPSDYEDGKDGALLPAPTL